MMIAAEQLRLFIERIERLSEEKQGTADDIKDVFAEAKANGFDVKTMRKVIALRKLETHERQEAEALLECYCDAIGLTPMESYAKHLREMDDKGIGVSIAVGDGPQIPLNQKAREAAEAKA